MQSLQFHDCGLTPDAIEGTNAPAEGGVPSAWLAPLRRAGRLALQANLLANVHAVRALPQVLMQGLVI